MTPQELVQREVIYCVSCLISDLGGVAEQLDDYDTYLSLVGGKPDYEEAAHYFIFNDADLSELEEIVDEYAWWNDVVEVVTDPSHDLLRPYIVGYVEDDVYEEVEYWATSIQHAKEQCRDDYRDAEITGVQLDDTQLIDDWCDKNPPLLDAIRQKVWEIVDIESGAYEWVCEYFNLEPEYGEIYEHWIVSDWLGRKLSERGHVVESYLGMTIWGRGCTGQAIYMDGVMEQICNDL